MHSPLKKVLLLLSYTALIAFFTPAQAAQLSQRPDVQAFIQRLVQEGNFDTESLSLVFDAVALQPKVIESISRPAEAKDWPFYEKIFITNERVEKGYAFWLRHHKALQNVQREYGVPASIIVSILGVETFYGEKQGEYRVMDALSTLAFEYPPREKFFKKELAEYLRLVRDHHIPPFALKGSYAGAIGLPQFMPSSYRHYAVTYQGTHTINLQKNEDDVIASVANYLNANGWQPELPIATQALSTKKKDLDLITPNVAPTKTLGELRAMGFKVDNSYNSSLKANIVALNTPEKPLYYMGFNNFYTIMRYNTSVNYAMAVYTLSSLLERCAQAKAESCGIA